MASLFAVCVFALTSLYHNPVKQMDVSSSLKSPTFRERTLRMHGTMILGLYCYFIIIIILCVCVNSGFLVFVVLSFAFMTRFDVDVLYRQFAKKGIVCSLYCVASVRTRVGARHGL